VEEFLKQCQEAVASGLASSVVVHSRNGTVHTIEPEPTEYPFVCEMCGKRAKSRRGLTKHRNTVHGQAA
jgi:hypothetical protein